MIRDIEPAFIKIHILYHADKENVFGIGLMQELAEHGYTIGPGTCAVYGSLFMKPVRSVNPIRIFTC